MKYKCLLFDIPLKEKSQENVERDINVEVTIENASDIRTDELSSKSASIEIVDNFGLKKDQSSQTPKNKATQTEMHLSESCEILVSSGKKSRCCGQSCEVRYIMFSEFRI